MYLFHFFFFIFSFFLFHFIFYLSFFTLMRVRQLSAQNVNQIKTLIIYNNGLYSRQKDDSAGQNRN